MQNSSESNEIMNGTLEKIPLTHRLAFTFARAGWRGSQYIWALSRMFGEVQDGRNIRLPSGFPIEVNSEDWMSKTIYEGTYERALLKFLDTLEIDGLNIDVGANIGVTLWHSMHRSKSNANYCAFEPSPQCFERLSATCEDIPRNGEVFHVALGSSDGFATLFGQDNPVHSGLASLDPRPTLKGNQGQIKVRKLDSFLDEYQFGSDISLLKIDTEGYEASVVEGASNTFRTLKSEIIIMEVSPNFGSVNFLRNVKELINGNYIWFNLTESGHLKKSTTLFEVELESALVIPTQWNLVLIRKDTLEKYKENKNKVKIVWTTGKH